MVARRDEGRQLQKEICTLNHDIFCSDDAPLDKSPWFSHWGLRATIAVPMSYDLGSYPQLDSFLALILQDGAVGP